MDIKKILKNFNIDDSIVEDLKEAITKEIGSDFIPKSQYNKKVKVLDELQEKYNDLEATVSNDKTKEEYENLKTEFESYKTNIETEKVNKNKIDLVTSKLKSAGANENVIDLLVNAFKLDELTVEDNDITNWDNVFAGVKEKYSGCFGVNEIVGNEPQTPPVNGTPKTYTLESVKNMSAAEIAANYSQIQKDLANS